MYHKSQLQDSYPYQLLGRPMHKIMIFILAHSYEGLKLLIICILAFFAGEVTDLIDTANNHPAITSILAGGLVAMSVRFIDKWLDGRNKTIRTADKVLELQQAEQKELRAEHAKMMADKETWWKIQNDRLTVELFELRQRRREEQTNASNVNHSAINELMRLQNIILGMQHTMVLHNLEVPAAAHIDLTKFMLPAWEKERDEAERTHITMDTEPGKQD